jgi:hypothetical protein
MAAKLRSVSAHRMKGAGHDAIECDVFPTNWLREEASPGVTSARRAPRPQGNPQNLGVTTYQAVHNREKGVNDPSAELLPIIAEELGCERAVCQNRLLGADSACALSSGRPGRPHPTSPAKFALRMPMIRILTSEADSGGNFAFVFLPRPHSLAPNAHQSGLLTADGAVAITSRCIEVFHAPITCSLLAHQ